LAGLWSRAEFGCATAAAAITWAAWQPFERGHMLWRRDTDAAYAFFNSGRWLELPERWHDGLAIPSRGSAPGGLQAPVRGFGYVWGIRDDLYNGLGWATDQEEGFCALVQPFAQGFLLRSSTVESCWQGLYNFAREPGFGLTSLQVQSSGTWHR